MVGDQHTIVTVFAQDAQNAQHVDIAFVDEGFPIVWGFAADIAEMDVGDLVLAAVGFHRLVDVAVGHFGQGAEAEFQRVGATGFAVDEFLIEPGLVHQTRLVAHGGCGWIVRVGGEYHICFLGDRHNRVEEFAMAAPEFLGGDRGEFAGRGVAIIDHVPDHPVGDRFVIRAVHADDFRAAAAVGALDAPRDSSEREVVSHHRDADLADGADKGFDFLELFGLFRSVEKHIVPMGGIEVFDRLDGESVRCRRIADRAQLFVGPELVGVAGESPAAVVTERLIDGHVRSRRAEVVDHVNDQVARAALARESEVIVVELVAVESEAEFHDFVC